MDDNKEAIADANGIGGLPDAPAPFALRAITERPIGLTSGHRLPVNSSTRPAALDREVAARMSTIWLAILYTEAPFTRPTHRARTVASPSSSR
jgi:hypothetical protein